MRVGLFCLASSLILISLLDISVMIAPLLKILTYTKLFFISTLPALAASFLLVVKKGFAKLYIILGGWEAWSVKKLFRHGIRFIVSVSARIFLLTFLINLFFGKERKGIKQMPLLIISKLKGTWIGRTVDWWNHTSERQKRITTGLILCLILILVGQALIGVSILVFDIVWEVVIVLSHILVRALRIVSPVILRLIPNAIGSFITGKLLPFFAQAVPVIKDDFRVIYLRVNLRERYREYRKRLLKYSRANRPAVRARLGSITPGAVRTRKDYLLNKALAMNKPDNNLNLNEEDN